MTIDQFFNKYNGKFVEYHSYGSGALNQCVDIVNQYIKEVLNLTPIIGTDAKDFPKKYNKSEFDWIPNTPTGVPEKGDIIVWSTNHIAIINTANVNNFVSFDQNYPTGSPCKFVTHNYNGVSGWLRAKTMPTYELTDKQLEDLQTDSNNWKFLCTKYDISDPKQIVDKIEQLQKERNEWKSKYENERESHVKDNGSNESLIEELRTRLDVQEAKNTKLEEELANADTSKNCDQLLKDKELEVVKYVDESLKSLKELKEKYDSLKKEDDEITGSPLINPEEQKFLLRLLIKLFGR